MLGCHDRHRIRIFHRVSTAQLRDGMFQQIKHQARRPRDQRRQRRESKIRRDARDDLRNTCMVLDPARGTEP